MDIQRDWTVLFIGGASGMGKSSAAYELSRYYHVNVMEADDIFEAVKAVTNKDILPAVHYWSSGVNWMDLGVNENIKWLTDVSSEMVPCLREIVNNHLEGDVPVIIEGDFIQPEFVASFKSSKVKSIYIYEPREEQILKNYYAREGGELQNYRAKISTEYGRFLVEKCNSLGICVVEARPWNTVIDRIIRSI